MEIVKGIGKGLMTIGVLVSLGSLAIWIPYSFFQILSAFFQ
jgi:hypothetical protein